MRKFIDKKLFLILLGYMGVYHIVYIFRRVVLKAMGRAEYSDLNWWLTIFEPIFANLLIVPPIILLVLVVTKMMINRNMRWIYVFLIHFGLSFIYSIVITAFGYIYEYIFFNVPLMGGEPEFFFVRTLFGSNLNFLGYVGFVTIIYSYYYIQRISQSEIQKVRLSKQLQNAKMEALKAQLNPHFLFNTLNVISSLIKKDAHKAQHTLGNLGDLMREVLLVKGENMIEVHKEMTILNKYVEIMQIRFSDHLSVKYVINENVREALMPSMLLQPILENSFKHGYSYDMTNLEVDLSISKESKWLKIEIKNNGTPIIQTRSDGGMGLQNVKERLETLFEGNYIFNFSNLADGAGVQTLIKIPLIYCLEKQTVIDL